jgi:hypothetical protein
VTLPAARRRSRPRGFEFNGVDSSFPRIVRLFLKGPSVTTIVLAMFVIFSVAGATAGVVLLGMEGRGKSRAPQLADRFATAAQHLNGDAEPPARFTRIVNRYVAPVMEHRQHAR